MTKYVIPELDRKGLREFGLTTGAVVAVLFGGLLPWLLSANYPVWPWIIFAVFALLAIVSPIALKPIYRLWMRFGLLMSKVMTPLVLGIVFYLLVLPMGIVMRAVGKDPMARRMSDSVSSYRVLSRQAAKENIERPF